MIQKLCLWVYVCLIIIELKVFAEPHPDNYLSLEQRIKRHGYPIEIHQVITEDGYILSSYRIPHGSKKSIDDESKNKSAVLFLHGLGGSPHNWILLRERDSIPYYLADRGFDVWLISVRGGYSSLKQQHIKYNWNEDPKYWDFSLHELGKYDLAANIDYVISQTRQSEVFFVGVSAGCPQFFILLSERPEYNEKIKIGVQLASSPILKKTDYSLLLLLCSLAKVWKGIIKYLNMAELPQLSFIWPVFLTACQDPRFRDICIDVVGIIGTHNSALMEEEYITPGILVYPRLSTKLLMHYVDNINGGDFRNFNYGPKKNMRIYGQKNPPRYSLSNCTAAVAFFHASRDQFCIKEDVYEAINELPNVVLRSEILNFTHIDFVVARNATYLVYEPVYNLFKNFDEGIIPEKIGKIHIPDE